MYDEENSESLVSIAKLDEMAFIFKKEIFKPQIIILLLLQGTLSELCGSYHWCSCFASVWNP
jgi:hypothetical protein